MALSQHPWYALQSPDETDSPALLVYPDRVLHNIREAIAMRGDARWLRPHVKTHKSPDVTRLMLQEGIVKFKCATIAEAEMLAICGAPDVLLAYQPIGPKINRLLHLVEHYPATRFSCLVDQLPAAINIASVFNAQRLSIPVYIDLNLGQNRTGIDPDQALELYLACDSLPGIVPVGLHGYDGHIRDLDWNLRKQNADAAFARIDSLAGQIRSKGLATPAIVAGGSPTFSIHCKRQDIDCSPGTFIYWDKGYLDLCPEQLFLAAAAVVTRVVSVPAENRVCLDLGHKSIAPENELARRVWFPGHPELTPISQSEEHLVVEAPADHGLQTGDLLYGIPYHICPTVALYERALTVENGRVTGEWMNTARDRRITI